jgi:hypothetical protein
MTAPATKLDYSGDAARFGRLSALQRAARAGLPCFGLAFRFS